MSLPVQIITLQPQELANMLTQAAHTAISQYKIEHPDKANQEVFTVEEAAEYLRFISKSGKPNPKAIHSLRKEGKLKSVVDHGIIRITIEQINEYLHEYGPIKNPLSRGQRV